MENPSAQDPPAPTSPTLDGVLDAYIRARQIYGGWSHEGCTAATIDYYEDKRQALALGLGAALDVNALSLARLEAYIARRRRAGVKAPTIGKELGLLRAALFHARRAGVCRIHPDDFWPIFRPRHRPRVRVLRDMDQVGRFLAALPARRRPIAAFLILSGACVSEWPRIERRHVDLERKTLEIPGTKTRYRQRTLPIARHPALVRLLRDLLKVAPESGPILPEWPTIHKDMAKAAEKAGLVRLSPHDLRRTFATLFGHHERPDLVGKLMGHRDGRMVEQVYRILAAEDLGDVVGATWGRMRFPRVRVEGHA